MVRLGSRVSPLAFGLLAVAMVLGSMAPEVALAGPSDLASRLDAYLRAEMEANRLPGIAVGVVQDDETIFLCGYGQATAGAQMTPQTQLYIASVSKSFTALAIMQLVEDGAVALDTPVQTYLPWFALAEPDAARLITIRQLLHQTSGLGDAGYPTVRPGPNVSLEEGIRALRDARPVTEPGTRFQYFNDNYNILGAVVQQVSGMPFAAYLREHVLSPLDMRRTVMDPALAPDLAQGYGCVFGWPVPRDEAFVPAHVPSGFVISTAEDMTRYVTAQLNAGRYGDTRVLSEAGMATMHSPGTVDAGDARGGYAMGWFISDIAGTSAIIHGGDLSNFHADVVLLPEENLGMVLLVNENGLVPTLGVYPRLLEGIVRIALGDPPPSGPGLVLIGWILAALVAATVVSMVRKIVRSRAWAQEARPRSHVRVVLGTAGPVLLGVVLLALPRLLTASTGRVARWGLLFELAPDLIAWAWFAILSNAILTALRLRALWREQEQASSRTGARQRGTSTDGRESPQDAAM